MNGRTLDDGSWMGVAVGDTDDTRVVLEGVPANAVATPTPDAAVRAHKLRSRATGGGTDLSIAALDGAPTTGSWGLSLVLYGLGLAFVACFAWIGTRVLLAARRA